MSKRLKVFGVLVFLGSLIWMLNSYNNSERVSPLMIAAKSGDVAEVTKLIAEGSQLDAKSKYNWTALMFASWQGHAEIVVLLIDAGADINATSTEVASSFETTGGYPSSNALSEAIRKQHPEIIDILIERGADIDTNSLALAGGLGSVQLLENMVAKGGDLNQINDVYWHRTALSYAASQGNLQNIAWLVANGADPNLTLPSSTNLSRAVQGKQSGAVALLIELGADPNQEFGSSRETALWEAIAGHLNEYEYLDNVKTIEILLNNGADTSHLPVNYRETFTARVERNLERNEQARLNPEHDHAVRNQYRRSENYWRAIWRLLKAHHHKAETFQ